MQSQSSTLPAPDVYLNHFIPAQGIQQEAARNLSLVVLGATIWDILIYVPDDIMIICRSRPSLVLVCFVFSRVFACTLVLLAVLMCTHPIPDCHAMAISVAITIILAMTTTSFLFLQRVRALYTENSVVRLAFTLLWLAVSIVVSITVTIGVGAAHVPGTQYCHYLVVDRYTATAGFSWLFFDTLVFLAVSYWIISSHSGLNADVGPAISWVTFAKGQALPKLSRAVLQGGQQYYFIVICLNLPCGILLSIPSVPSPYKVMMTSPLITLAASMACRVFRNLRMQDFQASEMQYQFSDVEFNRALPRSTVTPAVVCSLPSGYPVTATGAS
ncbi:hypothetical protein D9756_007040 [Leucocoprinus leucothites]|uniref:Uncharacterized protein n=1 Tax=Leucocoprinus leucothites TaxID=201217 RepID=A0A8H5D7N6_9AGAR|nr:hypothetical protein D9756_007040 [Leucoagaricus leucothites]